MADNAIVADQDPLRNLLVEQGIQHVAIVDDAFDPIDVRGLTSIEQESLWASIEFNSGVQEEFTTLGVEVHTAEDVTDELVANLLERRSQCPTFGALWDMSDAAQDMAAGLSGVEPLAKYLCDSLDLKVRKFGSTADIEELIDFEPQIIFLDWHLGSVVHPFVTEASIGSEPPIAVQAATEKVMEILRHWPDEKTNPLIVLMSSMNGMPQDADDFCRRSKILRGMFHAVPKNALGESFSLRMHMQLFAMSLPEGRRIQAFMDALPRRFQDVKDRFLDDISDLTLNDYSYIQRLALKDDGQPLGDFLLRLFSTYLGQLLFAVALRDERADLDSVTFGEALPTLGEPSERLKEVYHTALFDTSVGPVRSHPLAAQNSASASNDLPALALGDLLKREPTQEQPVEDGEGITPLPNLLLLINAQCDLEIRPQSSRRLSDDRRSILLLPGKLKPLDPAGDQDKLKTALYQHDGGDYSIEWDTKKVLAIPHDRFTDWQEQEGYERVARLRLPFALEIQRAFAADLTRVGTPVTPPMYQSTTVRLLRRHATKRIYEAADPLQDEETAFLALTKTGQECVLTIPLLVKLKGLLDEELAAMRTQLMQKQSTVGAPGHLSDKISSLERAIAKENEWAKLRSPFIFPKKFFNGRIQIVRGAMEGDNCDNNVVVAVSLDLD